MDFSIVVPTFNRPHQLTGCLQALSALEYDGAFEVVVVDDGGAQDLSELVSKAPLPVRLLRQDNAGPGAARNTGADVACGRWLAFTDDDCRPHASWLTQLRAVLEADAGVLAGGRTINQLKANPFAAASQWVADAAYQSFNPDPANARFLASNNMAVGRDVFLAAGGFDESFRVASEDRELCDRWTTKGGRIVWTSEAIVQHRHDLNLRGFLRQHYRYGRGAARFHRLRARRGRGSLWSEASFRWRWGDLLLRPALESERPLTGIMLLIAWQVANTAGFVRDWWRIA